MSFHSFFVFTLILLFYSSCSFTADNNELSYSNELSTKDNKEEKPIVSRARGEIGPFHNDKSKRHDFGNNDIDPFLITYDHSDLSREQKDSIYERFVVVFPELVSSKYLFGGMQYVQGVNRLGDTILCFKKEYFSAIGLNENGVSFEDVLLLGGETFIPCARSDNGYFLPYPAASVATDEEVKIIAVLVGSQWGEGGEYAIDDKLYFVSTNRCEEILSVDVNSDGGVAYLPSFNAFMYDSNEHYTLVFPERKIKYVKGVTRKQRFLESQLLTKIAKDNTLSVDEKLVKIGYLKQELK